MQITMPKACISCQQYTPKGFDQDEHCPHRDYWGRPKNRTQYGSCSTHGREVFATEICSIYRQESDIAVEDAPNRPAPRQARQERLF